MSGDNENPAAEDTHGEAEAGPLRIFICYRRAQSELEAQQVFLRLRERFGESRVFIDRKIAPSAVWRETITSELQRCTAVVVLIGDRFAERFDEIERERDAAHREGTEAPEDEMLFELSYVLSHPEKKVFPLVVGPRDMPPAHRLPAPVRELLRRQAIVAPLMYFDTAMDKLTEAIAAAHKWVEPTALPMRPRAPGTLATRAMHLLLAVAVALAGIAAIMAVGRILAWLATPTPTAPSWPPERLFWEGARYVLATLFGGLGPFLVYWVVAEVRVRARLPFYNLPGMMTAVNMFLLLYGGSMFLLLSTLPGWHLQPLGFAWIGFDPNVASWPQVLRYALLGAVLLVLAGASVFFALMEPGALRREGARRARRMRVMNVGNVLVLLGGLWLVASLVNSLEAPAGLPLVPVLGYLMLCPVFSLLLFTWQLAHSYLGLQEKRWPFRMLLYLLTGLYGVATMALYAHGPLAVLDRQPAPSAIHRPG